VRVALGKRHLAGVILFSRNCPTIEATHALCRDVWHATPEAPFVAVDQEGGRVQRLKQSVLQLPPMRRLGGSDPELIERAASVLGRQLAAIGFNLDFAPVLDVDSNPENPVIGDRAFSDEVAGVVTGADAFARGLASAGVLSCGKHYPGHGDTDTDSHLTLPRVRHDRTRLDAIELAPFRALAPALPCLMSAHVVYDHLDDGVPATLSRAIATDLLRGEIGFRGVLFSDDLEMRALADRMAIEESAVGAIRAGCDVLLVCRDVHLQGRAHRALVTEAERDPAFRARCEQAATRSRAARKQATVRVDETYDRVREVLDSEESHAVFEEIRASSAAP
jgi:beta-N-acetylhexosaminidase